MDGQAFDHCGAIALQAGRDECRLGRSSDSSVLVKAKVRCSRFGVQLAVPAAAWALALRSLSMFTWSLSIPVSTLRATASRSAMSGVASE